MLSADGSVQQRRVLSHHADLGAQTILGRERDILAVDQHPSPRYVVETQQQIDDGALAGPGAAQTRPIFSPGRMWRLRSSIRGRAGPEAPISEAHGFEPYIPACGRAALCIGPVEHRWEGERASVLIPVLHRADCSNSDAISHMTQCEIH